MNHLSKWTVAAALIGTSLLGCEQKVVYKPAPPAAPSFPTSPADAAAALVTQTQQFDNDVESLPGASAEEHRQILSAILNELPRLLQLANGSKESPEFQNRLSVIDAAARTVAEPGIDRRRMEAVENQALQSAAPALAQITALHFFDDDQLPPLQQMLSDKVDAAAHSVGPVHDLDATNAFVAMQAVVDRINGDMSDMFLNK